EVTWWANANYSYLTRSEDVNELRQTLRTIRSLLEHENRSHTGLPPVGRVQRVSLKKILFQVPAYPAPPVPRPLHEGLVASLDADGKFVGVVVVNQRDEASGKFYFEVSSAGYENPEFSFYILDDAGMPSRLEPVSREGNKYYYERHWPGRR